MTHAIAESIPMAIGIAVFPIPIIAVVLMLTTDRARVLAPLFVAGWVVGLGVVGTVALIASDAADAAEDSGSATWVSVVKIVIAVALFVLAWTQYRGRSGAGEKKMPAWIGRMDAAGPATAWTSGLALAGANPKNVLLVVAGATSIAQTGISGSEQALALCIFVVVATLGVGVPTLVYFVLGTRALPVLARLKDWMGRHMAVMVAGLCLVIAIVLLVEAVSALRP